MGIPTEVIHIHHGIGPAKKDGSPFIITIMADTPCPDDPGAATVAAIRMNGARQGAAYADDAQKLHEALRKLPGGTYFRLASLFREVL